jgi:hypothetical protein
MQTDIGLQPQRIGSATGIDRRKQPSASAEGGIRQCDDAATRPGLVGQASLRRALPAGCCDWALSSLKLKVRRPIFMIVM